MTARPRHIRDIQGKDHVLSGRHDRLAACVEGPVLQVALDQLSARVGEEVLDLGPGTGRALLALARDVGAPGRVFGVDPSIAMLRQVRPRLAKVGATRRVTLLRGEATHLPLRASALDAVLTVFTLETLERRDIARALAECRRVLRPGGRIVVASLSERGEHTFAGRLYDAARARYPHWLNRRPIRIAALLATAGYDVIDTAHTSVWALAVDVTLARSPAPR